jgi:hypothetical protein
MLNESERYRVTTHGLMVIGDERPSTAGDCHYFALRGVECDV